MNENKIIIEAQPVINPEFMDYTNYPTMSATTGGQHRTEIEVLSADEIKPTKLGYKVEEKLGTLIVCKPKRRSKRNNKKSATPPQSTNY